MCIMREIGGKSRMKKKSLILFLLGSKGHAVLNQVILISKNLKDLFIVIGEDSNTRDLSKDKMIRICVERGIKYLESNVLDKSMVYQFINESDLSIAAGWRNLLPTIPGKLIIFHDSLLPKYRGFNPLVTALINGDDVLGVSALWAAENYDEGKIIFQETVKISYPIKIKQAIDIIEPLYANLTKNVLSVFESGKKFISTKQIEELATYSLWRDQHDYFIDWSLPASVIKRTIDASGYPYEGSCTYAGEKKLTINDAEELEDLVIINRQPGKIIFIRDQNPIVVCGKGLLKITSAHYANNVNALPLKKFRIKFTSHSA